MNDNDNIIIDINPKDKKTKVIHTKNPKAYFASYNNRFKLAKTGGITQIIAISIVGVFFFIIFVGIITLSLMFGILNYIYKLFKK